MLSRDKYEEKSLKAKGVLVTNKEVQDIVITKLIVYNIYIKLFNFFNFMVKVGHSKNPTRVLVLHNHHINVIL